MFNIISNWQLAGDLMEVGNEMNHHHQHKHKHTQTRTST